MLWAGNCHLGLVGTKYQPISAAIVPNNVDKALEASGATRQDIGVIGDTYDTDADGSNKETKQGGVCCKEARVDITFKMATWALMALAGPFVLFNFN